MGPRLSFSLAAFLLISLPASSWGDGPELAAALQADREAERLYGAEDTFASATRSPKPLSQVPEDVAVVTAEEIEAMNAHTLAEVLNRVTGVFVEFQPPEFGGVGLPHIQGSGETEFFQLGAQEQHVLLLVDGVPWNQLSGGPPLRAVPIGIVDRVEILKGPGSSAWGSALGGVVNVLTKSAGEGRVSGTVSFSAGEYGLADGRAEVAGSEGPVRYYLEAQGQGAEWTDDPGRGRASAFFGKVSASPAERLELGLAAGTSTHHQNDFYWPSWEATGDDDYRIAWAQVSADARLAPSVGLHLLGWAREQRQDGGGRWDGAWWDGTYFAPGELLYDQDDRDEARGAQGRLVWTAAGHAVVVGADYQRGELESRLRSGPTAVELLAFPADFLVRPSIERWGAYANDTVALGPASLTVGLRYDGSSLTDDFWSPSAGVTLRAGRKTLLRASVARGFTIAPLPALQGGGQDLRPNPDLGPERVWSYQAGAESAAVPGLWLRATVFRHEATDSLEYVPTADGTATITVNMGHVWRTGAEAEVETAPVGGFSARVGAAYVLVEKSGETSHEDGQHLYQANVGLAWRRGGDRVELFGHYVWWDLGPGAHEGSWNDWIWEANAVKRLVEGREAAVDLFATLRNVGNGDQYNDENATNADRTAEVGARVAF